MFQLDVSSALRSRLFIIVLVVAGLLSALGGLVYAGVGMSMHDAGQPLTLQQLVRAALVKGSAAPLVAGALGAVLAGRLFRHGGLSTALWLTPRRGRLLGVTLGPLAALGAMVGLAGSAAVMAVSVLVGAGPGSEPLGAAWVLLPAVHALVCAATCVVGGSVAILLGSQAGALAVMLVGPMMLEPMARGATNFGPGGTVGSLTRYLPTSLVERIQIDAGNPVVPVPDAAPDVAVAAILLTAVVLALVAASHRRLARIDA